MNIALSWDWASYILTHTCKIHYRAAQYWKSVWYRHGCPIVQQWYICDVSVSYKDYFPPNTLNNRQIQSKYCKSEPFKSKFFCHPLVNSEAAPQDTMIRRYISASASFKSDVPLSTRDRLMCCFFCFVFALFTLGEKIRQLFISRYIMCLWVQSRSMEFI